MLYPVKIEFREYPSGSWQDWSEYLAEPPRVSKKVESENEGEAGVVVFDDASVSFRYESGSPVYSAFSIDLTSKQRYLFRISTFKTDKTFVQLFEGVADFSTLKWNEYNNVIGFSLVDKLSALNLLQGELTRVLSTLNARILASQPSADGIEFRVDNNFTNEIWIKPFIYSTQPDYDLVDFTSVILNPGEIIRDPTAMYLTLPSKITYALVTESWIENGWNKIKYLNVDGFDHTTWFNETGYYRYPIGFGSNCIAEFGEKEIYGIDVLNYISGIPQSINGLSLIDILIKKAWSDATIIHRGISSYNIPLSYYIFFLDENPLGKTPLDALKLIADSMKCYIFFDRSGNLIVQSKSSLDTGGTTRSINNTKIISGPEKNYFWDKLADGVTINVKSWAVDEVTGKNLVGAAELTKQPTGFSALQKIKPKNSIKKEMLVGEPNIDTQQELDTYAAQEALSLLNFYGLRHASFDLILNLDDNTIDWELIDRLTLDSLTTFFTKLEFDLNERTVELEAVEITGHDYDFRQLIFGSAESSSSSYSTYSGSSGGASSGITPIFNLPLQMSGGIVSLLTTDNLKLTTDKLDTAQPIKTTDSPTFAQLTLSNPGTITYQAVRADRTVSTAYPLSGGGNLTNDRSFSLLYNSTNLKLTSNQLDTIQNINSTATPTFVQLTLSNAATTTSHAVRADRLLTIQGTSPISVNPTGQNLTQNRTWTVSVTTNNLIGTTNQVSVSNGTNVIIGSNTVQLSLPQDIHTGASPTFVTAKLTNLTDGYLPYHIADATGLGNSPIYSNGTNVGLGTTTLTEKFNLEGNFKHSGYYSFYNNFASGWAGSGWKLDYSSSGSSLEIDNLLVRGSMTVYELIINQIRSTNGSLFVTSSAKVDSFLEDVPGYPVITFEDPDDNNSCPFATNDILLIQRVQLDGLTVVKRIYLQVTSVSQNIVYTKKLSGSSGNVAVGDFCVRIGNTSNSARQGAVYLTSDDSNSPFIDITDGVTSVATWTGSAKLKGRFGKLSGIVDTSVGLNSSNVYGLYTNSAYLKGNLVVGGTNAITLSASTIAIGNVTGTANSAIKLANTGTGSTSGLFGYNSSGSELFALKLDGTAQIAGWSFTTNKLSKTFYSEDFYDAEIKLSTRSTKEGFYILYDTQVINYTSVLSVGAMLDYSETPTGDYGIMFDDGGNIVFRLGRTYKDIAGWSFDSSKFYKASGNYKLSLNTSTTPYIGNSQTGFEVWSLTNPKMFIGTKTSAGALSAGMDWNMTTANTLTIKGNIVGGTITGSKFQTLSNEQGVVIGSTTYNEGTHALYFVDDSPGDNYLSYFSLLNIMDSDTGTYPSNLTANVHAHCYARKWDASYSEATFALSFKVGGLGTFAELRSAAPGAVYDNQVHGLYIANDNFGTLNKVLGRRRTGWATPLATASRVALPASPTVAQISSWCRALYDDLAAHGLIGA